MNPPNVCGNRNFGNLYVATSVLNDEDISTETSCLANVSSDVVKENEMNPPELRGNRNFRNSSVATSVLNDVVISDVVKENVISCELNPKFCVAKIRGLANEKSILILVDTGSTVSIVNDCFVNRRDVSEVNNVCITSASGDKMEITGKANVNLRLEISVILCIMFM
ncbi:unnamed protein product [Mytilus coruscus]|uniref:Peptidase A2 domain-containing protein n=1 Tax=Mytilus coruscus TaxID=42192 RepID=A0A6J8DWG7_MYTCO|nr:unnamed protein product [Mytilus coruscus]